MSAEGLATRRLMQKLKVSNPTLNLWRRRYQEAGIEALVRGKTRAPGIPPLPQEKVQGVATPTLSGKPTGTTHWSCRTMAAQVGISKTSVNRIWHEHDQTPHRVKGFKVSNDPLFEEKLRDVIGLYMNPPEKALAFSVDEKSQIQALDRAQPGLRIKPGKAGTMTHDYKRHGTTTLFAALTVHDGTVIGERLPRYRWWSGCSTRTTISTVTCGTIDSARAPRPTLRAKPCRQRTATAGKKRGLALPLDP